MNKPDKAGEPSMEEILASIRQIIADEPGMDRPAPGAAPAPRVPTADRGRLGPAPRDARSQPLLDRLNGVLKSPQPPTSPFGSKRPLPFDQDLADMLGDEGAAEAVQNPAPKPDIRVAPELITPPSKTPGPGPSAPDQRAANTPAFDGAEALPPHVAPPASAAPAQGALSPPLGGAGAEPAPPPPKTFGFPPLKKQGFYPPQSATPLPRPPQAQEPMPDVVVAPSEPARPQPSPAPGTFGAAPALGPVSRAPDAEAAVDADDLPLAQAVAATLAAEGKPRFAETAAPVPPAEEPPIDARPPAGQPVSGAEPFSGSGPRFAAGAADTVAAAQALDALAQGLAASAAASAFSAAGVTPPLGSSEADMRATTFSAPVALTPAAQPARTLEDAVADMLRPMLQQWVADNMPRIIERALRAEAGRPTKPGSGSP